MTTAIGACALQRQGLVSWYLGQTFQTTLHKQNAGRHFCFAKLFYLPDIDEDDKYIEKVLKTDYGPMRVPTKE